MKKLLIIFALLIGGFSYGQVMLNKATKYLGITTAVRDGITINAGEYPVIYNTTTGQFERYNGSSWESWNDGTGTDDQNISGSGLSGVNLTIGIEGGASELVDLSSLVGLESTDIDTFAELDAIVADETLALWRLSTPLNRQ